MYAVCPLGKREVCRPPSATSEANIAGARRRSGFHLRPISRYVQGAESRRRSVYYVIARDISVAMGCKGMEFRTGCLLYCTTGEFVSEIANVCVTLMRDDMAPFGEIRAKEAARPQVLRAIERRVAAGEVHSIRGLSSPTPQISFSALSHEAGAWWKGNQGVSPEPT